MLLTLVGFLLSYNECRECPPPVSLMRGLRTRGTTNKSPLTEHVMLFILFLVELHQLASVLDLSVPFLMRCFQIWSAKCSKHRVLLPWRRGFAQFVLRPYQQSCLDACHAALRAGITRIGVSLPTGAGKTTIFTTLLSQIPSPEPPRASGSLIIVNSVELARQAAAQAEQSHPCWKIELEQGVNHRASGRADV